ncbi:AzlD domain-containing protein [Limosilactobacillus equigenerosi]|uniref:Branched-chain amino acid transporter n=1 Tax=Limosilactobacillus equigenerosi DSM 18793 = JCM 14505 TaxID=1423742 RepID=A0A0R1UYC5_9LACO|nr:AzlD domain-containing protein [Limosilactobacillus equigenerosi]KRL96490.1 hypothetical protein FC21_GL001239 [Limosilactobacillus equigenerosi DSM 18793 = JCM 14505]
MVNLLQQSLPVAAVNTDYRFHIFVIIMAAIAAFLPRYIPLLIFTSRDLPAWFNEWMKYVPVSLFTALVVKDIFLDSKYMPVIDHFETFGREMMAYGHVSHILAGLLVMVIAYFTRSMVVSVLAGLLLVWLISMVIA